MNKINVCVVDDHALFREAMQRLISTFPRINSIDLAANGSELIQLLNTKKFDVVLLDLVMPVMDGKATLELIEKKFPLLRVIILSMEDNPAWVDLMIRSGAHGYLSKNASSDEVHKAIREVVDKGFYYNKMVCDALAAFNPAEIGNKSMVVTEKDFSQRELEVIELICREFTMQEISDHLNISSKTVQNHRSRVMDKMGVRNTAGLVKSAIMNRLYRG